MHHELPEFLMQCKVWGYACDGLGDISVTVAEQRHPTRGFRSPTIDAAGRALWDDASRLLNVELWDGGTLQPIPWWWALPGVVDAMLQDAFSLGA